MFGNKKDQLINKINIEVKMESLKYVFLPDIFNEQILHD